MLRRRKHVPPSRRHVMQKRRIAQPNPRIQPNPRTRSRRLPRRLEGGGVTAISKQPTFEPRLIGSGSRQWMRICEKTGMWMKKPPGRQDVFPLPWTYSMTTNRWRFRVMGGRRSSHRREWTHRFVKRRPPSLRFPNLPCPGRRRMEKPGVMKKPPVRRMSPPKRPFPQKNDLETVRARFLVLPTPPRTISFARSRKKENRLPGGRRTYPFRRFRRPPRRRRSIVPNV